MAHTFGQNTTHTSAAGNPITIGFTTLPGETALVVMLKVNGATNRAGGALTFAGKALTQANSTQKAATSPEASAELWYLPNPPIGTYNVVIPNTGSLTIFHMIATGKAAPGSKSQFDVANGGNATSTNPTPGATVITADGAIVFAVVATGATTWAPSAQAGTVLNNTDDGADGTGRQYALRSARGTFTLNWTFGTSDDWGAVAAAFVEVPPVSFENGRGVGGGEGVGVTERIR